MWFKNLTGFEEKDAETVYKNIICQGSSLISIKNGQTFEAGVLEVATLADLRNHSAPYRTEGSTIRVSEIVADVQKLHQDGKNVNASFQAASQFNLLEMVSPQIAPEAGIDRYERDHTQGPACAIACGAGTIYRNYFAKVNGQIGQQEENQIDCLDLIADYFNNDEKKLWIMKNGYALPTLEGLQAINEQLTELNSEDREQLKSSLKVGIQWNTEVTISQKKHRVSQIYCSALPVAYSKIDASHFKNFAELILEATYEATLHAAIVNREKNGCELVYLTLVGGGAFGNDENWILDSIEKVLRKFAMEDLDVQIVSYGNSNDNLKNRIEKIRTLL